MRRAHVEQLDPAGHRHPRAERVLVRGRHVGGQGPPRQQCGVEAVVVDRHRGDPHALGRERGPGLGVARVLQRHRGADQAEGRGQGTQRGADARDEEQVVGRDGDAAAATQVLGEHPAQAGVRWIRRRRRSPAPPSRRCARPGARRPGRPARCRGRPGRRSHWAGSPVPGSGPVSLRAGGVHVGHGPGRGRPVGPASDHRPRPGPAHDEAGRGELVVRGDDRPAREAERQREGAGRGQGVAGP